MLAADCVVREHQFRTSAKEREKQTIGQCPMGQCVSVDRPTLIQTGFTKPHSDTGQVYNVLGNRSKMKPILLSGMRRR